MVEEGLALPFDPDAVGDMKGEVIQFTVQRFNGWRGNGGLRYG